MRDAGLPIELLHRGSIPSRRGWIVGIPLVAMSMYLGFFLGSVIFTGLLDRPEWPSAHGHCILLFGRLAFSLLMSATLFVVKRRQEINETHR